MMRSYSFIREISSALSAIDFVYWLVLLEVKILHVQDNRPIPFPELLVPV